MVSSTSRRSRIRAVAHWATVASLGLAAVLALLAAVSWFERPYPGFQVRLDRAVELYLPPNSTGAQAGLLPGDRVLTVDGRALTDPRALYAHVAALPIGTPVRYTLERPLPDGETRRISTVVATQAFDGRRWASLFLALWLTGVCFLVLGATVSTLKPGDPLARANWAFHMAGAAACLSIFDQSTTFLAPFQDPYKLLQWIVAVCFAHLALQFPRRYAWTAPALRLNLAAGAGLGVLLVVGYHAGWAPFWVTFAHLGYIALAEVILLANAFWTALSPRSTPRERGQGKILLLATLLSIVPALIVPQAHLLGARVDLAGLENFALPLWPLAISYAIARHQLFEISPLIKRSLVYLVSAGVLTLLYVLATTLTETVIGSRTQLPGIVGTVFVAFAFAPVRDGVKRWLDARFFRSPYHFNEVIAAFTRMAQETVEPQALMQAYLQALDRALAPSALAIFLADDARPAAALGGGEGMVSASCERLPLTVQDHVLGWVAVGPKKSDMPYTRHDRMLLGELTQLLAVWLNLFERFEKARLQSQEIEALKRSEAMQGQFLNVVSHELKIPLSVIMSSLNILERSEAGLDAKLVRHHHRIRRTL
ncbi:MAG: histidine kinase dimerization/phospho-acceptor domain-containing protein, partial [Candidatus Sericytochromatia bacterium]